MTKFKFTCEKPSVVTTVTKQFHLENKKGTDLSGVFKIHSSQWAFLPYFFLAFCSSRKPLQSRSYCFTESEDQNFFFHVNLGSPFQLSPVAAEVFMTNDTCELLLADLT